MKNRLKIAVYSGDIPSTTFIERLIEGLSGSPHDIYIFGFVKRRVSYPSNVSVFGYKNIRIYKAITLLKYSLLLKLFKSKDKAKLDKILKNKSKNLLLEKLKSYPVLWHKPDVFHIQWAKGLSEWIWLKEFGVKIVLSLRGAHINYSPIADEQLAAMYREHFPKVDGFHAVSEAIAQEAEKYGADSHKIKVVYSGLDITSNTKETRLKNDVFHIISVGRPHWKKGYTYALDMCDILKEQGLKFKYTIIGGAGDIELAYQIKDLDLSAQVTLLGNLPFSKVEAQMKASDLLVLPSVEEGIANVVLEAMALQTLVLTTDCGGMGEVIADGENGFIVPIRQTKLLAEKVIEAASLTSEAYKNLTDQALKTVKARHNEAQMVTNMLKLYEQI
ncbi:glycosyltransferase family 4 protein [Psychroserpens sp. SPM9]|uniref:glycosyltransferase family 4 protein n=1 Tax=Psychroserpens sp. SPM9 TaxID=2975598 RepID=UPI0021A5EC84|nr:glycosyltransferase family 4 protein [Psychroserpens sp. SPM9]MDG5492234.1 glycosyltransferase family 4 protein [Psychroserpens sp. SPM9]